MGTVNSVAPLPSGEGGGGGYEPFSPDDPYPVTLAKIRTNTVWAARAFKDVPYELGKKSIHKIDCSGLVYRVLFAGGGGDIYSADSYYRDALKVPDAMTNDPQPGDVFFLDWASNPAFNGMKGVDDVKKDPSKGTEGIDHTGMVDACGYLDDGRRQCNIIHATKPEVHFSKIVQNPDGKWNYYIDPQRAYSLPPSTIHDIPATNLTFRFADSLKMRGIPSAEEVNPLGGVDLDVPLPLDGAMLGMGDLKGFRVSADGMTITLYASKSDGDLPPDGAISDRGVNLSDVQEILNSLYRTGGQAPFFTLLPDAASAASVNGAFGLAWDALAARPGFYSSDIGQILYGESVWRFLGVQNPASFTMQAIFSDEALRNTHVGDVLMASDLVLKTLAFGDLENQAPTPYFNEATARSKRGENLGILESSRFWFQADPASFAIREMTAPDGSVVYDFADVQLHVLCRPIRFDELEGGVRDIAEACEAGSLSAWYADQFNNETTLQEIVGQYPVLEELREVYKAATVAKLLYQKGIRLPGFSPDVSEDGPWITAKTAEFSPMLYIGQSDVSAQNIPALLAMGGGGVNLDVDLLKMVRKEGSLFENRPFYMSNLSYPIGDVSDTVRALRIQLKDKPSKVEPNMARWLSVPPSLLKPMQPVRPVEFLKPMAPIAPRTLDDEVQAYRSRLSFLKTFYPNDPSKQDELSHEFAERLFFKILLAEDPAQRQEPMRQLVDIGPKIAVPMLIEKLGGENPLTPDSGPYERAMAAAILGDFGPIAAEALPALQQALSDSDPLVRVKAAEALKAIDPAGSTMP